MHGFKVVHLEVANTLETDSFLNALRHFISRHGPIRQLRSDQGTNFVGARRELAEALTKMDHGKIKSELLEQNQCDWFSFKMNVLSASHMGGVWERQIIKQCTDRTAKPLRPLLHRHHIFRLTLFEFEDLST